MHDIAIKVEGLGKRYIIKHERQEPYKTFQDVLVNGGKKLIAALNPFERGSSVEDTMTEEFWALKDIDFQIVKGDKVGIIGRNGAGKSTLLKVLSRITEPTTGKIHINGRIASLLEVGTGFHPELTGRENIYLNGAILGMSRAEIDDKFDEIVSFAEVAKFLDTPVKRYSSGMYVRLAFSVAAHLEPEILLIDEVLAVGDVEFQKKCLGKMGEVSKDGRTIFFVSHNMNAIEQFCDHIILMDEGKVVKNSKNVRAAIHDYLAYDGNGLTQSEWSNTEGRFSDSSFRLTYFGVHDAAGGLVTQAIRNDESVSIVIEGDVEVLDKALQVGYALYDEANTLLYWSIFNDSAQKDWPEVKYGHNKFISQIPRRFLNEGRYRLELIIALYYRYWIIEPQKNSPAIFFTIQGGLSDSPYWMMSRPGLIAPELTWRIV